jgi:hypothetical protein
MLHTTLLPSNRGKQVIAPYLVILRVANRSALTSDTIASGVTGSLHFASQASSTDSSGTLPAEYSMSSTEMDGEATDEAGVGVAYRD